MTFKSESHRRWWFAVGRYQNLSPSEQKRRKENEKASRSNDHGLNKYHR